MASAFESVSEWKERAWNDPEWEEWYADYCALKQCAADWRKVARVQKVEIEVLQEQLERTRKGAVHQMADIYHDAEGYRQRVEEEYSKLKQNNALLLRRIHKLTLQQRSSPSQHCSESSSGPQ